MQRSPSGIWVPSHGPSNKFTAHDVKPENRRFLHGRLPTDDFQQAYSFPEHWKSHARARIDGCAEVITKVAVLKARNGINDSEPIVCTGAVYQDFRGAPKYHQRAHRFPCNPWIGVFTLPELALRVSRAMWVEMVNPLAATDIVPNYVNSGDTGIEGNGTYRAMQSALREVIQEQKSGRSVNPKLIQHVLMFSLLPKLRESIGLALEGVQKKSRSQWDDALQGASAFSPEGVEALNRSSIETKPDPAKSAQAAYLTENTFKYAPGMRAFTSRMPCKGQFLNRNWNDFNPFRRLTARKAADPRRYRDANVSLLQFSRTNLSCESRPHSCSPRSQTHSPAPQTATATPRTD